MKALYILFFFLLISFSSMSQVPAFKVTVYDSSSTAGYYFLSNTEYLMILDKYGELIYYKQGNQLSNFALQPDGVMTYYGNRKFFLMDSTFKTTDSITCRNVPITNYHDLHILANGHVLLIGTDSVRMNLSWYPYWKEKSNSDTANVKYTVVQEQDTKKNVVFEWRAIDHYDIDDIDTFFLPRFPLFDWTHPDAVEMDRDGNILLSNRNFNEITKINRADGSIIWRLGGKRNQFKFINCAVPFYGQHDIRRIDNGHITLFDDGDHIIPHGARAMEFELDEKGKTAKLVWSYTYDSAMFCSRQGNVQRLSNSNTLINYGNNSVSDITFLVIDKSGKKLFQLDGIRSYRVFNYPALPWQLHRPQITCYDSSGVTYLDAGAGYNSYKWGTGDSTRVIPVTKVGSYNVFVPDGQGGYISSEKLIVTEILHPCGTMPITPRKKPKK